jgi:hypothetical protein
MFSYSLSYSQFGLPFLSYYCFKYYLSARSGSLLIWFKISINGHASSHGLQFPVTLDNSGGLFFKLSSSFQLRCTHSFGLYIILDLSIASGLFLIYFRILFLAYNLKVDLVNRMILIRFDAVDSIIAFWLVRLHERNTSCRSKRLRTCHQSFMTVRCLISIQTHHLCMDMNHTSRCIRNPWANKLLLANTACR